MFGKVLKRAIMRNRWAYTVLTITIVSFCTIGASADWSTNVYENNPVDLLPQNARNLQTIEDGNGGAIVFYIQEPESGDIYGDLWAQKIDKDGNLIWGAPAPVFDSHLNAVLNSFEVISDNMGGAFLAVWGLTGFDFRVAVQHVGSDGVADWGPSGTAAVSTPTGFSMMSPTLVRDGSGGVIVTWSDGRNLGVSGFDIWAQRLDGAGVRQWGDGGIAVCSSFQSQMEPDICTDSAGGAYLIWLDSRNGGLYYDIYGQHLLPNGAGEWSLDGVSLLNSTNELAWPIIIPGGTAGDFFVFCEYETGVEKQIRAARYSKTGDIYWWKFLAENPGSDQHSPVVVSDGMEGAFVAWFEELNVGGLDYRYYVQHVGPGGNRLFGTAGTEVALSEGTQYGIKLTRDGSGGVVAVWQDFRDQSADIYSQRLSSIGTKLWGSYGAPVTMGNSLDHYQGVVSDGEGGIIAVWAGERYSSPSGDVYAQRMGPHGKLGDAAPKLTTVEDFPQDQGGMVRLDWTGSYLDVYPDNGIQNYTIWQRQGTASKIATPSISNIHLEAGRLAKITGMEPAYLVEQLKAGWVYMDQVNALALGEYSYHASTYGDSTDTEIVYTDFMVFAHLSTQAFWQSQVISGYSVDNLVPGMPKALVASYLSPDGVLDWSPSTVTAPDLDRYRIYRSDTPGFLPGPASFVGATNDTSFADLNLATGTWHYLITAVDFNGNESDSSNQAILQTGSSGVGDETPSAFRVVGAVPNPFNPSTAIHFSLARDGQTTIEIFDTRGRLVRQLLDRSLPTGQHQAIWDGHNDQGRALPSGVYLARVRSGIERGITKMILAK